MRQCVPLVLGLFLIACGDSHRDGVDGGGGSTCLDPRPNCVRYDPPASYECSDLLVSPVCVEGAWACIDGTVLESEARCWCFGHAPDPCVCTPSGWVCDDAGLPDAGISDAGTRSFDCGPEVRCDAVTTYCVRSVSDVAGIPDSYTCEEYPATCTGCACLGGDECTGTSETGITVTFFGG
jgi:hypothetical protein